MNKVSKCCIVMVALLLCVSPAFSWTTIGDGIEYQAFTISDPNNLFVTRMQRNNPNAILDVTLANGSAASRETVPSQYSTNNGAVIFDGNDWGPRYNMVAAINGDFYQSGGASRGVRVSNGWYATKINSDQSVYGAFAWTTDRQPIMAGYPNATQSMNVSFLSGNTSIAFFTINNINAAPGTNELSIYTPQNGLTTGTSTDGSVTELLVQLKSPNIINQSGYLGKVKSISTTGSTMIPFDCIVLAATGTMAANLTNAFSKSDDIRITTSIRSYKTDGRTYVGNPWKNAIMGISGSHVVLENGVVKDYPTESLMTAHHPRTAIAYNSDYIFFVVCDGRATNVSVGMTGVELGTFCKNTLGATDALNLDGGGSSTLVKNGTVMNKPSDGSPRAVATAVVMANILPKDQSSTFGAGQYVSVTGSSVNLRRGPGTIHPVITAKVLGDIGTITYHRLSGIMTKGSYWWNVKFGDTEGWMSESYLAAYGTTAPTITLQPSDDTTDNGKLAALSVEANGSGKMIYRWQKGNADIYDNANYQGTTTPNLKTNLPGSYRCIVSNDYGTATSSSATVTGILPVSVNISDPSAGITKSGPVNYTVSFENATTINPTFTLNKTGTANASIAATKTSDTQYTVELSNITGDGTLSITVGAGSASNSIGSSAAATATAAVVVDNTAPGSVTVTDSGKYTMSHNTLSANWTESSDANGIAKYQYAVGTSTTTADVKDWGDTGNQTSITDSSMNLDESINYYMLVRAIDNAGNTGAISASDGILVVPTIEKIGNALSINDSTPFALMDKTVTATKDNAFWIEENDRSMGLKVISDSVVNKWDKVSLAGYLSTQNGTRTLLGDVLVNSGATSMITPLGMICKNAGGGNFNSYTPGITNASSLYNVGLFVRCWGKVSGADTSDPENKFFYLNDGSMESGLLVKCGSANPPDGYAIVDGIVCADIISGTVIPYIWMQ